MKSKAKHSSIFLVSLLSLIIGFILTFFLSNFFNTRIVSKYNEKEWFFLNRGYPIPMKGLSIDSKELPSNFYKSNKYKTVDNDRWVIIYNPIRYIADIFLLSLLVFVLINLLIKLKKSIS